jgi:hypothetical protein
LGTSVALLDRYKWDPIRLKWSFVALLALLAAVWIASQIAYSFAVKPKATTLTEFMQVMPVDKVWQAKEASGTYTFVKCHPPTVPLAFPSGPLVHKFDAAGKLVDWTSGGS